MTDTGTWAWAQRTGGYIFDDDYDGDPCI